MPLVSSLRAFAERHPGRFFAWLLAIVTLVKLVALIFSQVDLGPDESQYWWWSKDLDFGYFSKPPMIAWLIALGTGLFGDVEWAVRLTSPLITSATAWMIYLIASRLYGQVTGVWAGIGWITMPVILMSNTILSTDIPLLFFWSVALYGFIRLGETEAGKGWGWAVLVGLGVGFGMMSKYAMIYFPLCLGIACLLSATARKGLRPAPLLVAVAIAAVIFTPNILWNAANDFHTLDHTGENAGWGRDTFNFDELAEFLVGQFLIAGPLIFGFFLWRLARPASWADKGDAVRQHDLMLLGFTLPPLLIICFQAFISKANANWAMAAYPALMILTFAWLWRARRLWLMRISTGLHAAIGVLIAILTANLGLADALGLSDGFKRNRGWTEQGQQIMAQAENYDIILVDDRELMGNLLFYMPERRNDIRAWDVNRSVDNHYEAFFKYAPEMGEPALLVAKYPQYLYAYVEFANILDLGPSSYDTRVKCPRVYMLYELSGYDSTKGEKDVVAPEGGIQFDECRPY